MADALIAVVQDERLLTVTELAAELGVTARAIRFYEDKGLIQPGRVGATRAYTRREHARMQLILRGKRLGFSLREIKEFLDLYDVDPEHDEQKRLLLRAVRDRIRQLRVMNAALVRTLDELQAIELQVSSALER
ncbi:MerR family DNA-binding transcriptional regulator [Lichenicola cladoniae]|uniref:MerR family DNA-binding transcriptional regulator n=1 Tax=Lichenicola cladoniae TaxID=1484109 RepID=A0A6M8HVW5_9PROT|nr:MerR family DNA-binding transcriptional regulator [Lichenicola cladoniae]NPD66680.1 MerR family DNA-binding transcriptional regulator [Acetobacteraceae bacterium]QKE92305.1 MerR family DNA-binding transcriptional regulator [Lichenicola cladoniae]